MELSTYTYSELKEMYNNARNEIISLSSERGSVGKMRKVQKKINKFGKIGADIHEELCNREREMPFKVPLSTVYSAL